MRKRFVGCSLRPGQVWLALDFGVRKLGHPHSFQLGRHQAIHGLQSLRGTPICATVPIPFVIADGITAMEGNGPLQGNPRRLGKIVLADDPIAADATCARLMGFDPLRVRHLSLGCGFLGNLREDRITMLAEEVRAPARPFSVLPEFQYLLAGRG